MERKGTDEFLRDVMAEEGDAEAFLAAKGEEAVRPIEAEWPEWSGYIRSAWAELQDDRHIGAMGGLGRVYFTAIDRYGTRMGIGGVDFDDFLKFIRVLDDEYVAIIRERQKAELDKRRQDEQS